MRRRKALKRQRRRKGQLNEEVDVEKSRTREKMRSKKCSMETKKGCSTEVSTARLTKAPIIVFHELQTNERRWGE